ncbi:methyltransferase domain-containing protein [Lachnospiraceae bacterium 48-33]
MAEYIATFITGFNDIVKEQLIKDLPKAKIINVYDGLIYFEFDGYYKRVTKLLYLNNIFYVLHFFRGRNLSFENMIELTKKEKHKFLISEGTYRVRFSKENQFAKVDKRLVNYAEKNIQHCSNLKIDRVHPRTEVWYIIRTEKIGFFCQLFSKREATEKNLNKGELRPELAYLMCICGELSNNSIVIDPFCGYGAIPKQLVQEFPVKQVIASDIDRIKIENIRKANWTHNAVLVIELKDANRLDSIQSHSIDAVITDPPWGYFENIGNIEEFYVSVLYEMLRIIKKTGKVIILSARKEELINACKICHIRIAKQINTLVNGKKASIFILYQGD